MQKKRSKGTTIFGILAIVLGAIFFFLNCKDTCYLLSEKGISITLVTFFLFCEAVNFFQIIYGIGILNLKEWARKMALVVCITILMVYPLLFLIFNVTLVNKDLPKVILALGFPIAIVYYLTRPKVKEQFK